MESLNSNFNTGSCLKMALHILHNEMEKQSNIVFSPLSFHLMLSLIAVGSKGSTLDQLLSFLGSKTINELNYLASAVNSIIFLANETKASETIPPIVSISNGAWVDQKFGLKPSFQLILESVYHATAQGVDFANKGDGVIEEVNLWVEKDSKGLIKKLLPKESVDSNTIAVLANALFFKGCWNRKFDVSKTKNKDFHLLNGQIIEAPFMTSKPYQKHLYRCFNEYKVLKLPYQNGGLTNQNQFSMLFFLPHSKNGLQHLIQIFKSNPKFYEKEIEFWERELPEFWIPRFKFSFKIEASEILKELGLELPFKHLGEFTEMVSSSPESVVLSKIYHESVIEVNEQGTEAAASTAPRFRKLCAIMDPPSFVADHPFLFIIKEETLGLIFFIGAVLNPLVS